jgi:hypothetical protein
MKPYRGPKETDMVVWKLWWEMLIGDPTLNPEETLYTANETLKKP